jgi:hypothetical protein
LVVGVLVLVGLLTGVFDRGGLDGGPLAPSAGEGITGSGIRLDPGEIFSDRSALLANPSDQDAVLISIRRLGVVGELHDGRIYMALGVNADVDGAVTGAGEGFPPRSYSREDLKDLRGFRVPPSRSPAGRYGAVIMTVGRLRSGETFGLRGYEVTYRVGSTKYRTVIPQAVAVCAAYKERCNPDGLLDRMMAAAIAARGR